MKIGVFDSGLGGLTVLKEIIDIFDNIEIFYLADSLYAPYGEKSEEEILKRSLNICEHLLENHKIDALLIACNTATSVAIKTLREKFPNLIIIGAEPGIKPATKISKTKKIGVLATTATLRGKKYKQLQSELKKDSNIEIFEQDCVGLVEQIENGKIESKKTFDMLSCWLKPMIENDVDTIVLGCTHYPLVKDIIRKIMKNSINLIDTGNAIANRLESLSKKISKNSETKLDINIYRTGTINVAMIEKIVKNWNDCGKIVLKEFN